MEVITSTIRNIKTLYNNLVSFISNFYKEIEDPLFILSEISQFHKVFIKIHGVYSYLY